MPFPRLRGLTVAMFFVCAIAACGDSEDNDAADSPADSPSPEPSQSSESPSPSPSPEDSAAPDNDDPGTIDEPDDDGTAGDGGTRDHPLTGRWAGPDNEDGSTTEFRIEGDATVSMDSGGFVCTGVIATDMSGDSDYSISLSQCVIPMPRIEVDVSDDQESFTTTAEGETDEWTYDGPLD